MIKNISDLKDNIDLILSLAMSALDEVTTNSFVSFINDELSTLIDPEEILNTKNFKSTKDKIIKLSKDDGGGKRVDRLSTICTRLYLYLLSRDYKSEKTHKDNLISFLLIEVIPQDLLMSLYMDLSKNASDEIKTMMRDKKLANLLLNSM